MLQSIPPYLLYIAAIIGAAVISLYTVRKIIFITRLRKIYDVPDDTRKIHGAQIPSLGGIGIFTGYMVAAAFFMYMNQIGWNYIIASSVILFFTGIYDDLMNMRPSKKLIAQLAASFITVFFADIRLSSLYGVAGVGELPYWVSIGLTTICCTFFINVFNFVDGIDGLACATAILYVGLLGGMFAGISATGIAGIAFGLGGACIGLLYYNIAPAKIYMGDTGSMFLGFTIFLLSVLFVNMYDATNVRLISLVHSRPAAVVVIAATLFLPTYDAIRVFILRASRGVSPFKADRTHLHYYLLDAGFTHTQSVLIIIIANILLTITGFVMQDVNALITLLCITALASVVMGIVYWLRQRNLRQLGL
jgi:UDP-GlcNAc:undecaprenyl-phosphate GlcNAc-1-phosphate transferase